MNKKKPNLTDKHVGARVRARRHSLGVSQETLGDAIGITFQQIQKYEKGTNRIGVGRLQQIANVLRVPVHFFFEGGPDTVAISSKLSEDPLLTYASQFLATPEGLKFIKAFGRIKDNKLRRRIIDLAEQLGKSEQ